MQHSKQALSALSVYDFSLSAVLGKWYGNNMNGIAIKAILH